LNKLVRTFELLLNVSFKNLDRCRDAAPGARAAGAAAGEARLLPYVQTGWA